MDSKLLPAMLLACGTVSAASGTVAAGYLASLSAGAIVNAIGRDTNGNTLLAGQRCLRASFSSDASLR